MLRTITMTMALTWTACHEGKVEQAHERKQARVLGSTQAQSEAAGSLLASSPSEPDASTPAAPSCEIDADCAALRARCPQHGRAWCMRPWVEPSSGGPAEHALGLCQIDCPAK